MPDSGKVWVVLIVALAVLLVLFAAGYRWCATEYETVVNLEQAAEGAWANVDAALQRRFDLVPNLVETVKGYAEHEKELFENIARSREKYFQAGSRAEKIEAADQLSGLLSRLLLLTENYPQLRASDNFRDLQVALEGTENRISVARQRYNEAAEQLNSYSRQFFGSFFCRKAGVEPVPYFEATEQAKTEVPQVEF